MSFSKCLLCLSSPSLMHLNSSVIVSCERKERVMKRHQSNCLSWHTKLLRMSIFLVFWVQIFHQKHMFACLVKYYILLDFLNFWQVLGLDKKENQCSELSEKTMDILDNDVLVNLFVSTQKNNLDLCIEKSIRLVICYIYIFTLKVHRGVWGHGIFCVTFV